MPSAITASMSGAKKHFTNKHSGTVALEFPLSWLVWTVCLVVSRVTNPSHSSMSIPLSSTSVICLRTLTRGDQITHSMDTVSARSFSIQQQRGPGRTLQSRLCRGKIIVNIENISALSIHTFRYARVIGDIVLPLTDRKNFTITWMTPMNSII